MKRLSAAASIIVAAIAAAGCSNSAGTGPTVNPTDPTTGNGNPAGANAPYTPAATAALFQPAQGIFPFPNDLYFSGTTDGTINIQPANGLIPNQAGLNALDGWSTTAPIRIRFGSALNPASFSAANIRVYRVTTSNTNKAVSGFSAPLTYGTDFSAGIATDAGVGNTILEIKPLKPLVPSAGPALPTDPVPPGTGYLVLLLNGITMANGSAATADRDYATIKTTLGSPLNQANCATLPNAPMQGACGFTYSHLLVATNPALGPLAVTPSQVLVSFHFSTESTRDTLRVVSAGISLAAAPPIALVAQPAGPLNAFNSQLPAIADVRAGTVTVPYYSYIPTPLAPGGLSTDSAVLRTAWRAANPPPAPLTDPAGEFNLTRFNPVPLARGAKAIPFIITVPNAGAGAAGVKPAGGWPVAIFQHGITRDRTDVLALAGAFAQAGWAVVAVDLPLHGVTSTTNPFYRAADEQTFNLDLVLNATGATGQDNTIDPTGTHFINLTYPLASRDNLRQAVVNQLALARALPSLDLDANAATADIDGTRIAFVGQSLGAITGITFGSVAPTAPVMIAPRMAFSAPGGGLAELLRDSPTFGPRINAGLATQGLTPGTTLYAQFMRDVQAIIDAGDPLNYITSTVAQRSIYLHQVVGGSGTPPALPDQVIPNSATGRLLTAVGAALPRRVPGPPVAGAGYVNFVAGTHGSLLSPGTTATEAAVTQEMQREVVGFITQGAIAITNAAVVQP